MPAVRETDHCHYGFGLTQTEADIDERAPIRRTVTLM